MRIVYLLSIRLCISKYDQYHQKPSSQAAGSESELQISLGERGKIYQWELSEV